MLSAASIGMNLDPIVDADTAWTFTDAFLGSREWISHGYNTVTGSLTWDSGMPVATDANDWPTQLSQWTNSSGQLIQQQLGTLMFREIGGHYPAGVYHAQWQGTGTVVFGFDATVMDQGDNPDGTHFADLNVVPTGAGIYLKIAAMSSSDPIRNIHVWMPDVNGQSFVGQVWTPGANFSPFYPAFEQQLQPFGTLRFMNWTNANQNSIVNWSDRRTTSNARQLTSGPGVAYEYLIELANELHDDVWINVPYAASDDYITQMARLFQSELNPGQKIYIEYGNELWNYAGGFFGYQYITQQMSQPQFAGDDRWTVEAIDMSHTFDLWSSVFVGQSSRLVRVVGSQTENSSITDQILSHMNGDFDAVTVAGYISLTNSELSSFNSSTTGDQVLNAAFNELNNTTLPLLQQQKAVIDKYSASLARTIGFNLYEGGQSFTANGQTVSYQQALYDAQVNPRIYTLYQQLIQGFANLNGGVFIHYEYVTPNSIWGSWGALQWQSEPASMAPKYQALVDAAQVTQFAIATTSNASQIGPTSGTFTITRSGNTKVATTLNYTLSGTAPSSDYTPQLTGSIAFAANQTTATITITPTAGVATADETLTLTLTPSASYTIDPNNAGATMTIVGAAAARFGITASGTPSQIGPTSGTFTITRSGNTTVAATLNYTVGGTAQSADYTPQLTGSVDFVAGQTTATLTITPVQDGLLKGNRTLTVTLMPSSSYSLDATATSATLTIQDGVLLVGGLNATYYASTNLTNPKLTRVDPTVNFSWASGTAPAPGLPTSQYSVQWTGYAQATSSGNYVFRTNSDDGVRLYVNGALVINNWTNHTATLNNSAPIALTAGQIVTITMQYYNSQGAGTAQLFWQQPGQTAFNIIPAGQLYTANLAQFGIVAAGSPSQVGPTSGTFTITRAGNTAVAATLNYTVGGTAQSSDYTPQLTGSLAFAPNQTTATITITPVQDGRLKGNRTLTLTLTPSSSYALNSTATSATLMIQDGSLLAGGLNATYYASMNLTNPKLSRIDATVNFSWANNTAPAPGLPTSQYSIQWTGYAQATTGGNYVFRTNSNDGVRLYVNGNLVINNWTDHNATLNNSSPIALTAGQVVTITVQYYNDRGSGTIQLFWQQPGQTTFSIVPAAQLYTFTTLPVTYGAEAALLSGPVLSQANSGYVGAGYIQFQNASGDSVQWTVNVPSAGVHTLTFRYASAATSLPLSLSVNGVVINSSLAFAGTGGVTIWRTLTVSVNLLAGTNVIQLLATGSGGPNLNNLAVQ